MWSFHKHNWSAWKDYKHVVLFPTDRANGSFEHWVGYYGKQRWCPICAKYQKKIWHKRYYANNPTTS